MKKRIIVILIFTAITQLMVYPQITTTPFPILKSASSCNVLQDSMSKSLRNTFIWIIDDEISSQSDSDLTDALSYNPDVIVRGWFKWGITPLTFWNGMKWMISSSGNTIFGGGGTCSALFPGEVDTAKFNRIVDRNPDNQPEYFNNDTTCGYYHGDVQKTEYLNFLLDWVSKEIDAGAKTLFMDEVSGAPSWLTGYSDYGMQQFRNFLITKYVDTLGWSLIDTRWNTNLDINLALDCMDSTMNTFDYRLYLKRKGYQNDPSLYSFPLKSLWGDPSNCLFDNSYLHFRNINAWNYLVTSIRHYADSTGKKISITANGWNYFVDYQTEGTWGSWSVIGGRLNIAPSYISNWRALKDSNCNVLNKDIPVIVFHDWGSNMPFFDEIPDSDRILWLKVYAPEIFASGVIFAWPVSSCGGHYKPSVAVRDTMKKLISWYSSNRNLYVNTRFMGNTLVNITNQNNIVWTVSDSLNDNQDTTERIVHLINKNIDGSRNFITKNNFPISVFSNKKPKSVWAVSPDYKGFQKLNFTWNYDSATITVKYLNAYTVVVLDYEKDIALDIKKFNSEFDYGFSLSPNPATNNITIEAPQPATIEITNIQGQLIQTLATSDNKTNVDVSALAKGMYIVKVKTEKGVESRKFIKE